MASDGKSEVGTAETVAESVAPHSPGSSGSRPRSKTRSGASGNRATVGSDMQSASVERFAQVGRDRFEVIDELARGGLGRVFRARDPRTGRIVAIKEVLHPQPDFIARFAREALVTANLQHPSIVPVYEVGRWPDGAPFYAMKLVDGRTLDELIREATTTAQRVALLPHVIAVADALAYAHGEHVIHRDLKPANVLVGPYGETVVIDWGLAKNLATGEELEPLPAASTLPPDQHATVAGAVLGTPAYMPPEQALGDKLDERADVYAIGAILYHALGGARPYAETRTLEELLTSVTGGAPRPLAELVPTLPPELIAIVGKAMARAPDDRYPTAAELAADLRRFQAGQLVGAHRYTAWQRARRWIAQHRALVATAAIAVAVLCAGAALSVSRITRERDAANAQRAAAERARGLAERRFADSLEELARQAVIAGQQDRALPLLVGAMTARGEVSPTLGVLAAQARAAYTELVGTAPTHPLGTQDLALAHDGSWLLSTEQDGTIHAWDLVAHADVWVEHGSDLIEVSPDGTRLLGLRAAGDVVLRNVSDGQVVKRWTLPGVSAGDGLWLAAWSPDGKRVAVAGKSGRVFAGGVDDAALVEGPRHAGAVNGLAFSPSGAVLASVGADGMTALRDPATATITARLVDGAPSELVAVVWLDDARVITGDEAGVARIWRAASRTVEHRLAHPAPIYGVVVGGTTRRWIATFGHGSDVLVWDADRGEELARLGGHQLATDDAVADGDYLVTSDEVGSVYIYAATSGDLLRHVPGTGQIAAMTGGPTHRLAFASSQMLQVWTLGRGPIARVPGHTARITSVELTADGTLWTASHDGTARGVDLATGATRVFGEASFSEPPLRAAPTVQPPSGPHAVRVLRHSPDGASIVLGNEDGTITLYDVASARLRATWHGHTARVRDLVFSRDGTTAYSVGDTSLRRWDVATGTQTAQRDIGVPLWRVALVEHERVLAMITDDDRLELADARDLAQIALPVLHHRVNRIITDDTRLLVADDVLALFGTRGEPLGMAAHTMARSATLLGSQLVVASPAGDITIYTWPSLEPRREWQTGRFIFDLALRPDGKVLASIGDRLVRLWDPATGNKLGELEAPFLPTQLAWSPDGNRLAIAGASGTALVWDLTPPAPRTIADLARCAAPWKLVDSALDVAQVDPSSCARGL